MQDTSKPDMVLVCEALARIVGNKYGCKITLESLTDKETGKVVYQRSTSELGGIYEHRKNDSP